MLKIVGVALACAILILYLRSVNNELALPATIGSGIIILYLALSYVADTFTVISTLIDMTKVDGSYFGIIFKITAIGYLVDCKFIKYNPKDNMTVSVFKAIVGLVLVGVPLVGLNVIFEFTVITQYFLYFIVSIIGSLLVPMLFKVMFNER